MAGGCKMSIKVRNKDKKIPTSNSPRSFEQTHFTLNRCGMYAYKVPQK